MHLPPLRSLAAFARSEAAVLFALLIMAASAWAFITVADAVMEHKYQRIDEMVIKAMRRADDPSYPIGPWWMRSAALDITALGGPSILTMMVIVVGGYLYLDKKSGAMLLVIVASVSGCSMSLVLKHLFGRERPSIVPHLAEVQTSSFPSGHSMLSAVVYLTLGALLARFVKSRRLKFYVLGVAVSLTFLVGLTRVYLGVHYPTDVLAGWSAGLVWAIVCWLVARLLQRKGKVESASTHTSSS
jgi:undecaprenyl-diphosphatase